MITSNDIGEKKSLLLLLEIVKLTVIYVKVLKIRGCGFVIYKEELDIVLNSTKLNRQSLWPNNFEKQKVHLVLNVFDEKVVAPLEQKDCPETACFLKKVIRMWRF